MSYVEQAQYYREGDRSPHPPPQPRFDNTYASPSQAHAHAHGPTAYGSPSNAVGPVASPNPARNSSRLPHHARSHHVHHSAHLSSPLSSPHMNHNASPRFGAAPHSYAPSAGHMPHSPSLTNSSSNGVTYSGPGVRNYQNLEMASYPSTGTSAVHQDLHSSPMMLGDSQLRSPVPEHPGYYQAHHTPSIGAPPIDQVSTSHASPYNTPMLRHTGTPEPASPRLLTSTPYAPTLKVLQWTPQHGEEGTQVTIVLDAIAINNAPATQYSVAAFGPGSSVMGQKAAITRRFVVIFGVAPAPTKFARAQNIDGNGVAQSMSAGPNELDAFVVLSSFVPARQSMGPLHERIMVIVRVVDENSVVLEECIVGEWDAGPSLPSALAHRAAPFKRHGDELESGRDAPGLRSPLVPQSTPRRTRDYLSPPHAHSAQFSSPQFGSSTSRREETPQAEEAETPASAHLRHPPIDEATTASLTASPSQPDLLRTSQIPASLVDEAGSQLVTFSNKAILKLQGDLNQMAMGWSNEEWTNRRRLIQFWRQQEGNTINATFRPIPQTDFVPNSIVISCVFRDDWNECFVTSVDTIYLLEALVGVRFTVEEKNRIRRNLEGFKPMTVSKSKADSEPFFKLIMGFPNPKPRNIEKDVKVFPWKVLGNALKKIIGKYSATYTGPTSSDGQGLGIPLSISNDAFSQPQTPQLSPQVASSSHFGSPHLVSPHINRSGSNMNSPHLTMADRFAGPVPAASPVPSPRNGGPHAAPTRQDVIPPSPHHPQHASQPKAHMIGMAASTHRIGALASAPGFGSGHSRPGSFDFNSILESSNFAPGGSGPFDRRGSYSNGGAHGHLFPSAEDYGVSPSFMSGTGGATGGLSAPAMSHSRSFSEGPRRDSFGQQGSNGGGGGGSFSAGASPYTTATYVPQQSVYTAAPPSAGEPPSSTAEGLQHQEPEAELDELASSATT